jgi:hypothetical protein
MCSSLTTSDHCCARRTTTDRVRHAHASIVALHIDEPNTPPAPLSEPFTKTDAQPLDHAPSALMHNDTNVSPEIPTATRPPSCRTTASTSAAPNHPMIMCACDGIRQPNPRYANTAVTMPSPAPSSVHAVLRDPDWPSAMEAEFHTLQENRSWTFVLRPPDINVISRNCLFKSKLNPNGTLECHKAHWVIRGFKQCWGIDFNQTFFPVVKPGTIHIVLHLAASRNWPVNQLNVKNAFLHSELAEWSISSNLPTS